MGAIRISRSKLALVDSADHERIATHAWTAKPADRAGSRWYAFRTVGSTTIYMHRVVLDAPEGVCVDHINGDGLDNRRCNLRLATASQNNANRACSPAITMLRGVHYTERSDRYRAVIYVKGKNKHLGQYRTALEAAVARDRAAFETFGDFAVLNFPCLIKGRL